MSGTIEWVCYTTSRVLYGSCLSWPPSSSYGFSQWLFMAIIISFADEHTKWACPLLKFTLSQFTRRIAAKSPWFSPRYWSSKSLISEQWLWTHSVPETIDEKSIFLFMRENVSDYGTVRTKRCLEAYSDVVIWVAICATRAIARMSFRNSFARGTFLWRQTFMRKTTKRRATFRRFNLKSHQFEWVGNPTRMSTMRGKSR
jgi:hypothetical protein